MKKQTEKEYPETFDGVIVGSIMAGIGLLWFTISFITGYWASFPRSIYPYALVGLGALTIYRHWRVRK